MTAELAAELCQSSIVTAGTLLGPVLLAILAVSVVVGLMQTMMQMHDHSISFVPKLVAMFVVLLFLLPWELSQLAEFAGDLIRGIPNHLF
jgi:flagellar biosynthetic protein FliQ